MKYNLLQLQKIISSSSIITKPEVPLKKIKTQILNLFKTPEFTISELTNVKIMITFNSFGNIVILHVDSKNTAIIKYVQKHLNNKQLKFPGKPKKIVTIPLKFSKSKKVLSA